MINSQDIKNGVCIRMDGRLYFVIEFLHVKPGKGNTIMRVKFKDVVDGRVLERRFNIGEKLEDVRVERRPYQYLYKEGEDYIFMNNEKLDGSGSIVPLAFPMYAGPGAFTALLAITAEYSIASLCLSLLLCMLVLYLVLRGTHWLTKYLGQTSLYIIRKFFGIIVLAIACKLMFGKFDYSNYFSLLGRMDFALIWSAD